MERRNFLKILGLSTGAVAGAVLVKLPVEEEVTGNHHTVHWFNDQGKVIRIEKVATDSGRTMSIWEHIGRRDELLNRLKVSRL